jgi:hypothetical protein
MRYPAGACRRGVRHDRDAGGSEEVGQHLFCDVAGEFDARIVAVLASYGFHIARRIGMICARHDKAN